MNKLFTKKPLWAVVFAAAAIFAVTFVACGGDGDTKDNYITSSKVPANLATSSLLASLYEAGNDTIVISDPEVGQPDMVTIETTDLIIPVNKKLDLAGHKLTVDGVVLVVAGELAGLEIATADGGQIADSGTIIAKSAAEATRIAGFKATGASAIVIEAMSVPGTAGGGTVGKTYFFGDITVAADLANVVTVFGSVTLSAATTAAAPDLSSLASISGSLSLTSTAGAEDAAVAFAVGTLEVKGGVTVNGKATLADTTSLTVGGNLTLGDNVALTATSVTVDGNLAGAGAVAATELIVGGLTGTNAITLGATGGAIGIMSTPATIATGVTFKGSIVNGHDAGVLVSAVGDTLTGTSAVLEGFLEFATVSGAAVLTVPTTKTLTVKSGTLSVKASKTLAVVTGDATVIEVAVGATLDLSASGAAITLAEATSKVVLKGAASNSAVLYFGTAEKPDVVSGLTAAATTINATGGAAFKLADADASGQTDTQLNAATTIKSFTAAAAAKDTTIQGYAGGASTLSAAATFVKYS